MHEEWTNPSFNVLVVQVRGLIMGACMGAWGLCCGALHGVHEEWTNPSFNVLEVMANGCMVHAWMHGGIMSCIRNGPTPPTSEPC